MSIPDATLTPEAVLLEAQGLLESGGYQVRRSLSPTQIDPDRSLLAEDRYGVVLITLFGSWSQLEESWPTAQASLIELLADRLTKADPKSWEGYLVLLTTDSAGPAGRETVHTIRYDTSRIRKLVATGEDLRSLSDIEKALLPLLPLEADNRLAPSVDVMSELPSTLEARGLPIAAVETVVEAFRRQEPLVEALREHLRGGVS